MAVYLPIRSVSRSQNVRIGQQKILPDTTYYVDISSGSTKRELNHYQAIGSVIAVGQLTATNSDAVVVTGGVVSAGTGLSVNVTAGELRTRSTGLYVNGASATNSAIGANASGNPRIDLVVWDNTSGAVSVVAGTAAASPVAPATPAGKTALATVAVANGASAPGTITDVRPRP
jgi:hypothetical protein